MSALIYAKPAVRHAWADAPLNPLTDVVDPGDTYVADGWQQGVKPPRPYFNWLLNYAAAGIRYLCQAGVAQWDPLETYSSNQLTRDASGYLYLSLINNNINNVPANTLGTAWANPAVRTPNAATGTWQVPNIAWVQANFLPIGSSFASIAGSIANGQVPQGAVTQWQAALAIAFSQLSGSIANGQVPQGAVTQWQSALSIAWGQITGTKNADQLGGLALGPSDAYAANTVARYNSSGYLYANYFNQASGNNENPAISQFMVTNGTDNFLRKANVAAVASAILGGINFAIGTSGFIQIPGTPFILNWGTYAYAGSLGSVAVSFNQPFSVACVAAWTGSSLGGFKAGAQSLTTAGMTLNFNGMGGTAQTIYWYAIGN
jgi:hypothetical protein